MKGELSTPRLPYTIVSFSAEGFRRRPNRDGISSSGAGCDALRSRHGRSNVSGRTGHISGSFSGAQASRREINAMKWLTLATVMFGVRDHNLLVIEILSVSYLGSG